VKNARSLGVRPFDFPVASQRQRELCDRHPDRLKANRPNVRDIV
jgi:hypothetical protein